MNILKGAIALATLLISASAMASDLEKLAQKGYGVAVETNVQGEFQGCDFDRRIPLANGLIFVCRTYSYHYAYSPAVYILKSVRNGDIRVVIDGEEFDGELYRRR